MPNAQFSWPGSHFCYRQDIGFAPGAAECGETHLVQILDHQLRAGLDLGPFTVGAADQLPESRIGRSAYRPRRGRSRHPGSVSLMAIACSALLLRYASR
jgi:hypothetical protein